MAVSVLCLYLNVPLVGLQCPDQTYILFALQQYGKS